MISELQRFILTSAALVVFLAAAQNAGGLTWRVAASPTLTLAAAAR